MVRIRHQRTNEEIDTTEESLPFFPDWDVVKDESEAAPKSKPTTPKE